MARVWDIVQWGERLARLLKDTSWPQYSADEVRQIAVERCIEVIGEAARSLSDEFKNQYDGIPWRAIVQQRNVIAHGYFFLERDRLWHVATVEVPKLVAQLAPAVAEPPKCDEPEE